MRYIDLIILLLFSSSVLAAITDIDVGGAHTCAVIDSGGAKCWGLNNNGQLGDGTTTNASIGVDVTGLVSGVDAISAGNLHTCALISGGVKCWGRNNKGQLGNGNTVNQSTPVDVTGLTSVTAISAGYEQTCALISDGSVKCWGSNNYGQLGDGTTTDSSTPVNVSGLSGVTAIITGFSHTCALTSGGMKCWGFNDNSQLGDGTTTDSSTPINVSGLSGVTDIAVGFKHTCALSNGGVKCWGVNDKGHIGDGTTTNRSTPTDVSGLTSGVTAIAAVEGEYTCALTNSGGAKCWGFNDNGQSGNGTTTTPQTIPVDVSGLTSGVTAIATAYTHTCALINDGSGKCWGQNGNGQLGEGTTTNSSIPVDINLFAPIITEGTTTTVNMSEDGSPTAFSLTLNATDDDVNAIITWSISTPASNGTAGASGTGTSQAITYTPNADYYGTDSFVVQVNDGVLTGTITVNVNIEAVPEAPTNLITNAASDNQINLSWTDNSTDETGFKIKRDGTLITTTAANVTNYSNTGLSCDRSYSYSVTATNGTMDSTPATVTKTLNCPIPSYKLTINPPSGGSISGEGINCGSDCSQYFEQGTQVTLIAIPWPNLVLVAWEGDCDKTGTVLINEDKTCTAQFLPPNLNLSATTLNFTEGEASSYSLWLNTVPSAPVTITLTVDNDDLVLSETLLTFDETNWNVPQTIEITHVDDNIVLEPHEHFISHTVTSDDPNYEGLIIEDIQVMVTDNDAPGINISSYEVTITEGQGDDSYSITLITQPLSEVTIQLRADFSDHPTLLSPETLVLTADNWNVPQNVIVSVEDDQLAEGNHEHSPIVHQVTSDDPAYNDLVVEEVQVHVIDNDIPNLIWSTSQLNITEGSTTSEKVSITLTTVPTQPVTVTLTPGIHTVVMPQSLVFDSQTWNIPQTVNVSAIDDQIVDGNHTNLILVNTASADINYQGLSLDTPLTVNITDNDSAGIELSSHEVTVEEGKTDSYTIVLMTEPTHEVAISLTAGAHTAVSPNQVIFNASNWNQPQTMTVSALQNDSVAGEGTQINTIVHKVSSDDPNYNGFAINSVTVNIIGSLEEPPLEELIPEEEPLEETTIPENESPEETTISGNEGLNETSTSDETVASDEGITDSTTDDTDNGIAETTDDTSSANPVNSDPAFIAPESNQDNSNSDSSFAITSGPIALPTLELVCQMRDSTISSVCKAEGQWLTEEVHITDDASVSKLFFEGHVNNDGLISNTIFTETASLTGGKLTGYIVNLGTIRDTEFTGILLTGGTLAGTIINSNPDGIIEDVLIAPNAKLVSGKVGRFIKCAAQSVLRDILMVPGTVLLGGRLDNGIRGYSGLYPGQIGNATILPGTVLSNVRLSPTVKIPDDVIFGPGVLLPSDYENPILEDFGANPNYIQNWHSNCFPGEDSILSDVNVLKDQEIVFDISMLEKPPVNQEQGITCVRQLEPAAFELLEPEQVETIPPAAFSGISAEQISFLSEEAVAAITIEQFEQLPAESVSGLTLDNMKGVNTDIIELFSLEHVAAINDQAFQQLDSEQMSRFLDNFIDNNISVSNVEFLLPPNWSINPITAELTAPTDSKLTLRHLQQNRDGRHHVSGLVFLPNVINLNAGFGLGGSGLSLFSGTRQSLEIRELSEFLLSQNEETGILEVLGTGKYESLLYTFIPDADSVFQVDGGQVPVGLSIGKGGFFKITMPDEVQYRVLPAPKDPEMLSEVLGGGQVVIGIQGEVLMDMPETDTRKPGKPRQVAMFSPLVQPAPDDLCVEIAPGETVCDFDNAPPSQQPGINLSGNTRQQQEYKVIYSDGTSQTIMPTVLSPEIFSALGFEFDGVEGIIFNADGSFYVLYQGQYYQILPAFETVQTEEIIEEDEPPAAGIVVNPETSTLTYSIAIEEPETNLRKRGEPRQVMTFEPNIKAVPDDLCVEILPGDIVCDFE